MRQHYTLTFIISLAILCACSGGPAYKNPELSVERRTEDLLKRMTVEEKIGQLLCPLGWPMFEKTSDTSAALSGEYVRFIKEQHGGMLYGAFRADPWTKMNLETGLNPETAARLYNALQQYAIDSTRLGIPIILAEEAPHGFMALGTTVFPTGMGLSATWDPELMETVGSAIAEELRAVGAGIAYGPVIDLAREPRWSRVEETFGEDVYLTSEMASSMVRGASPSVATTLKHFVAYGIPQGGHNGNPSSIGGRDLRESCLPPFKAAIDAGALSVMTSYNSIDGVPCTANENLLRGVLKGDWDFDGFVVSDLVSIDGLCGTHHIADSLQQAGEIAINAGVDVDLGADCYKLLAESVKSGRVSMKVLDEAAGRVLKLKFRLGLFDHPYVDPAEVESKVRSESHSAAALQAARESIVLLENNGVLPLRKTAKVAVVGPNADRMYNQLGDYTAFQPEENIVTPLEGIVSKIGAANVVYSHGCSIRDMDGSEIDEAVRTARSADVIIAFVGGSSARDFGTVYKETGAAVAGSGAVSDMECGEGFDRASLSLLGRQNELLKALKATGKPLVVIYIEGRPLDKLWAKENADALLTQFYPGQAGGTAIADVLFGDYNPAGRLPVSVPASVGQLPVYYNKPVPAGGGYVEMDAVPLYPFGYGLSYTSFRYDSLVVSVPEDSQLAYSGNGNRRPSFAGSSNGRDSVSVSVTLTNTGAVDGDEVVQIYVTDPVASVVRPCQQLRAFRRVHVPEGESVSVTFSLGRDAFALIDRNMQSVVESGDYVIKAGSSSGDIRLQQTVSL